MKISLKYISYSIQYNKINYNWVSGTRNLKTDHHHSAVVLNFWVVFWNRKELKWKKDENLQLLELYAISYLWNQYHRPGFWLELVCPNYASLEHV